MNERKATHLKSLVNLLRQVDELVGYELETYDYKMSEENELKNIQVTARNSALMIQGILGDMLVQEYLK